MNLPPILENHPIDKAMQQSTDAFKLTHPDGEALMCMAAANDDNWYTYLMWSVMSANVKGRQCPDRDTVTFTYNEVSVKIVKWKAK